MAPKLNDPVRGVWERYASDAETWFHSFVKTHNDLNKDATPLTLKEVLDEQFVTTNSN